MSCCSARRKIKRYKKNNKIHPKLSNNRPISRKKYQKISSEDISLFISEVVLCGTCKKAFPLHSNQIVGNCGGCNQFLHCGIAGKCIGEDCKLDIPNGGDHRLTWCIKCVPQNIIINIENNNIDGDCLCKECSEKDIYSGYLNKI